MFTERTLLSKSGNYPVTLLPCCSGTIPSPEPAFPGRSGINAVQLTVSRSRSLPGLQLGAGSRNADEDCEERELRLIKPTDLVLSSARSSVSLGRAHAGNRGPLVSVIPLAWVVGL